ncbi:HotDog domain-containing protein [Dipodascopsis tothii]|uniref:HotDog domain-containing protein n=1 Tax=Dipodascopsis tothii TaxID=44089 RepID=UPI0034CFA9B5
MTPKEQATQLLRLLADNTDKGAWDAMLLDRLDLIDVSADGWVDFELTVTTEMCNPSGMMHGGCIATVFDLCSSVAIAATSPSHDYMDIVMWAGVSRALNVMFLRPVPSGETVQVRCDTVSGSKTMALSTARLLSKASGKLLATATHDKVRLKALL